MIIYLGDRAAQRDTLDFLTDMLEEGYVFEGISLGYAKLKYTGHHDHSSKIGVMSRDDYERLTEKEKADFKYIDETGKNVLYQTKKSIGDNRFYLNKEEEKERNPSNYIIGGLVAIAVIAIAVKVISSLDTQSVFKTLGDIFLQPAVLFLLLLPSIIWILAWAIHKLKVRAYEAEDGREGRKKARKWKLIYNTVMNFCCFFIQIGITLAPLLHR